VNFPGSLSRIGRFLRALSAEKLSAPEPGKARSRTNIYICLYLFLQIVLPLNYYLRSDKSDERFAWRMFSAVKDLQRACTVSIGERQPDGRMRPLSPDEIISKIPASWMYFLATGREAAVGKFLRYHCRANPTLRDFELIRVCDTPDRSAVVLESLKMDCQTGELNRAKRFHERAEKIG